MTVQRDGSARDALIQIDKVLRLEERQGFRDASATVGLARFVGDRTSRILDESNGPIRRDVQDLDALLANYDNRPLHERISSVAEARRILDRLIGSGVDAQTAPAPRVTTTSATPDERADVAERVSIHGS